MGFVVTFERIGAVTVAGLDGDVDARIGRRARTQLLATLNPGRSGLPRLLVVDLTAATFLDSWGFGILVAAARQARAIGCAFCLVAPTAMIASVLAMTGLDKTWPIYPHRQAAFDAELAARGIY
jgi:anti-sigma B factor antagonist